MRRFYVVIGNPPYVRGEKIPDKARLRAVYGDFYRGTADLYTYFFRAGIDLLRRGGLLCFITSNKFMRADYGRPLRQFLMQEAAPRLLLDLGRTGTFDATVRPCIVLACTAAADRGAMRAAHRARAGGPPGPCGVHRATRIRHGGSGSGGGRRLVPGAAGLASATRQDRDRRPAARRVRKR